MSRRSLLRGLVAGLAATTTLGVAAPSMALLPDRDAKLSQGELADGTPLRLARALEVNAPPALKSKLEMLREHEGGTWRALWDPLTGVPARIYGEGIYVVGSVASPTVAEAASKAFLKKYTSLLAPGSDPSEFVMSSTSLDHGMRTVGFLQTKDGLPVLGGQLSFRFKNDRLFLVASEALPFVKIDNPGGSVDLGQATQAAVDWILTGAMKAVAKSVHGPVVFPMVTRDGIAGYRRVIEVTVASEDPIGSFIVHVDAATGKPIARRQTLMFASGTLEYNAPVRWPGDARQDYPASRASQMVNGVDEVSDPSGAVMFATAPAQITAEVSGTLVKVLNDGGPSATFDTMLPDGGNAVWNAATDEHVDAQLSAFIHVQEVNRYCKNLAPTMDFLDGSIDVTVNIKQNCNAFSDGTNLNFFEASSGCENTARLSDVVFHEFGHTFHNHAIQPGVGYFDAALSEGQADYLAATIHDDPAMGRGFFFNDQPLRDIDPPDREYFWPDDIDQDPHATGQIISGALWDLRKALVEKLGKAKGVATTDQLYYQAIQRAVDIPTMYPEVLAADDDDGNLANGTPNGCEINAAFGLHGLRTLGGSATAPSVVSPTLDGYKVAVQIDGLQPSCTQDVPTGATLSYKLRSDSANPNTLAMTKTANGFEGTIPKQRDGEVVQWSVDIAMPGGIILHFPDNRADPQYEMFVGEVTKLYCTDFEHDPAADGWTHGQTAGTKKPGADDWRWGVPQGTAGSDDPTSAFSGQKVFGNDLGGGQQDGKYPSNVTNYAMTPVVPTEGHSAIHVQYRRWLAVEDANFDQATVYANGELVWQNLNSMLGDASNTSHVDREWRFHDVEVTSQAQIGNVQIKYELASDPGLELGGWTLDDFCIVAWDKGTCGDAKLDKSEQCDDGAMNSDTAPNACRTTCKKAHCGDGVVDKGEECDDGNTNDGDLCHTTCKVNPNGVGGGSNGAGVHELGGCGCRAAGSSESDEANLALPLAALAVATFARQRRRKARSFSR